MDDPQAERDAMPKGTANGALASPPLAGLAAFAAWLDLVGRRGALRTLKGVVAHQTLLRLDDAARVVANLAALACFVVLAIEIARIVRGDAIATGRKVTIGVTAGLFLPCPVIATFLPLPNTTALLVLLGAVTGHVVALQVLAESLPRPNRVGMHVFALTVIFATLFGFVSLAASILGPVYEWTRAETVSAAARDAGELAFCIAPALLLADLLARDGRNVGRVRLVFAGGVALLAMGLFREARLELGESYPAVLYGALRLGALGVSPSWPYALALGTALFAGAYAGTSSDAADRRLGLGLLAYFAAGFSPRSPGPLLMMVVGATLVARGVLGSARTTATREPATRAVPTEVV